MALERLQKAKTLLGLLARGVRDAIRPHEEESYAPPPSAVGSPSVEQPAPLEPVASADAAPSAPSEPLVTPPPTDPSLLEAARADLGDPEFSGVRMVVGPSHVAIAWRAPTERLHAARKAQGGVLSLRMVAVRAKGESDVEVETLALGPAEPEGARVVARPPAMLRAVASVGVEDGGHFVSIAHADAA